MPRLPYAKFWVIVINIDNINRATYFNSACYPADVRMPSRVIACHANESKYVSHFFNMKQSINIIINQ